MSARTIMISAKCSDLFYAELFDGRVYEGYVPDLFTDGKGGGDFVRLEIDLDTGKIVDWEKPTEDDLDDIFGEKP